MPQEKRTRTHILACRPARAGLHSAERRSPRSREDSAGREGSRRQACGDRGRGPDVRTVIGSSGLRHGERFGADEAAERVVGANQRGSVCAVIHLGRVAGDRFLQTRVCSS